MDPWFAKAIVLLSAFAVVVIPASVHRRADRPKVVKSRKRLLERVLLALTGVGFLLPLLWLVTPLLSFADYPLRPAPLIVGALCLAAGLWFLYGSHADLGSNWSITLEVYEKHQLVTHGIYGGLRHPMYMALLLYALGLALVLPNWTAGPSYLVAMTLLIALRIGPEERMMLEEFGEEYKMYEARTKRLVPGIW